MEGKGAVLQMHEPANSVQRDAKHHEQPKSHLLDLPAELLLHILKLSVTYDHTICINHRPVCRGVSGCGARFCRNADWLPSQPAITRVNRLLRREGMPKFYSENIFHVCVLGDSRCHHPSYLRFFTATRPAEMTFYVTTDRRRWELEKECQAMRKLGMASRTFDIHKATEAESKALHCVHPRDSGLEGVYMTFLVKMETARGGAAST